MQLKEHCAQLIVNYREFWILFIHILSNQDCFQSRYLTGKFIHNWFPTKNEYDKYVL